MRKLIAFAALSGAVLLAGCTPTSSGPGGSPSTTSSSPATGAPSAGATSGSAGGPAAEPTDAVSNYKVTFDFAKPSGAVVVNHPGNVPPLRTLVGIYAGNHPTDSPAFQRLSFYFRGGYPSYQVSYVASVVSDGKGTPVSLPGNAFLRVVFTDSVGHTDSGGSSIVAAPPATIGFPNLKGYASAGDFEGHVTFGLGLQVASGSDQTLPIRVGELTKSDGANGSLYVVFIDIKSA